MLGGCSRATLLACALVATSALAQERLYLPLDPQGSEQLAQVDKLIEREQWDRAVTELDLLLSEGGDSLVERGEAFVTVRAEARRRLRDLPPAGQAAYALVHEGPARRLFTAGVHTADPMQLERLIASHVASPLVDRARNVLASNYLERAEPGAALPHLDALLDLDSLTPEDRERLLGLKVMALSMLGRSGERAQALEQLSAERRGTLLPLADRLRPAAPAAPPPEGSPLAWVRAEAGYYETANDSRSAWSFPRADTSRVYLHDGSHAQALDLESGRVRWRTPLRAGGGGFMRPEGHCRLALAEDRVVCVLPGDGGMVGLDRESGALSWRATLAELKASAGLELPGHFSGRPEVVGGVVALTLVTEHDDREVHVLGVDARSGRVRWRVFVASQTGGASPLPFLAQGEGRLVCVTGLGALAALSPQGELLWVVRYPSERDRRPQQRGPLGLQPQPGGAPPDRDPSAVVRRGFAWVAPADAKGAFAYRIADGTLGGRIDQLEKGRILGASAEGVLALEGQQVLRLARAGATALGKLPSPLAGRPWVGGADAFVPTQQGITRVGFAQGQAAPFAAWDPTFGRGSVWVGGGRLIVAAGRGAYAFGQPLAGEPSGTLRADLGHPSWSVRDAQQRALLVAGEASRARLEPLRDDPDPEVALRASEVLGELDRAVRVARWRPLVKPAWAQQVPDLLNRLTHPNPFVRLNGLQSLGAIQGDPEVASLLRELLQDPELEVALTAAVSLLGRGDRAGIEVLARALETEVEGTLITALGALAEHGEAADVGLVTPRLDDARPGVRAAAAVAALRLDRAGSIDGLAERFASEPTAVQLAILRGLGDLGAAEGPALEILVRAATVKNDELRLLATQALVDPRLSGREVYRALGARLGDSVREIQRAAATRLLQVASRGDVLSIPASGLEAGVKLKDDLARLHVSDIAIQYAYRGGRLTVETLCRLMVDPVEKVRKIENYFSAPSWATYLIQEAKQNPLDAGQVAAINSLTLRPEPHIRHNGFLALARAPYAPGRGVILSRALTDEDDQIRKESTSWLLPDGNQPPELGPIAMARLLRCAADPASPGHGPAKEVFDRLNQAHLVPLLLDALEHTDEAVRDEAGARLEAIAGQRVEYEPEQGPRFNRRTFTVWWWKRTHPDGSLEGLLRDLGADNPSLRWRSAKEAASLPLPEVRDRLAKALAKERAAWVQDEQLRALQRFSPDLDFGAAKRMKPAQRQACVERALRWWAAQRAREIQQGGPR